MKLLGNHLTWEQAQEALRRGHFIRHPHWCANKPISQPDYVGPTAAGADGDKLAVYTDDGIKVHAYEPGEQEKASADWQEVTLERELGRPLQEAMTRIAQAGARGEQSLPSPVLVTPTAAEVAALSGPAALGKAKPSKARPVESVRARRRPAP